MRVPVMMHMVGEAAAVARTHIAAAHRPSVAGVATRADPVVAGVHGTPVHVAGAAVVAVADGVEEDFMVGAEEAGGRFEAREANGQ